jgi:hypothetical protein
MPPNDPAVQDLPFPSNAIIDARRVKAMEDHAAYTLRYAQAAERNAAAAMAMAGTSGSPQRDLFVLMIGNVIRGGLATSVVSAGVMAQELCDLIDREYPLPTAPAPAPTPTP